MWAKIKKLDALFTPMVFGDFLGRVVFANCAITERGAESYAIAYRQWDFRSMYVSRAFPKSEPVAGNVCEDAICF